MTGEAQGTVASAKKTVVVKNISFEIEQRINAISRLDDGTSYDICQKCKGDILTESLKEVIQ